MIDMNSILPALITSAIISGGTAVMNQSLQSRLLEDNIEATKKLSESIVDLKVQIGILNEKFVTKDEFNSRIYRGGANHGS